MMREPKPSNSIHAAILFFLLFISFKLINCVPCPDIENQSLLSFKQSLYGPSNALSSWDAKVDCCTWEGVVCSNVTGRVVELHLRGLNGTVNPSLLNLKHLKYLDLSQNHFYEKIPPFIGSLTNLEYLNLSFSGFRGMVPHTIGNLSSLQTLSLEAFSMELVADSLDWLSGLSKLEYLNLNNVDLSKATNRATQVIEKLPSLIELYFKNCDLTFVDLLEDASNISRSNIAILDVSTNYFDYQSNDIGRSWIFQLTNLIYLDMKFTSLKGPITTNFNSTKLQHIDLSYNYLISIPEWLYSCKHLEFVNLRFNDLRGGISNSIANLTSLVTLDMGYNRLSGEIPRDIANLCNLQTLILSHNQFQGEISYSFGNMSHCFLESLKSLDLSWNQLGGHLTHQFGEFTHLQTIQLSGNSLSSVIPDEIGNLLSLERLELDGNKLEGVVTETHFAHLSDLKYFLASGNHLTLKVNTSWIPPFKLRALHLGSWDLGSRSRIPSWLETQKKSIDELDLSNTGIHGDVPDWLWGLKFLDLSHNQPDIKSPLASGVHSDMYQSLYLSSNNFSGPLPQIGKRLTSLDLSNNSFSGDLSQFLCNTTNEMLLYLHLEGNHLSGELPNCFKWQGLVVLNLGNNNLSGRIPDSIGFLASLQILNLKGNIFSGHIPSSLQNCINLEKIDVADNSLGGDVAKWINTRLSTLTILILRSNNFSGEISPSICNLRYLQILDLSNNGFSGIIPNCLSNLMATKITTLYYRYYFIRPAYYLERTSIATKGREVTYDNILALVTNIDLSNNNLSGNIPREITSLVELRSLSLSRNHLTGPIPKDIGNMTQLESLDLSMNSLSGEIPDSFTIMSSLNYLNLSLNNLTGRIPKSTQIQSLDESSFIGNTLCGPPLSISCEDDGVAPAPAHSQGREHIGRNKREMDWFIVFLSLGYAVGLSGVLTTLFLKRRWREAYYGFFHRVWDAVYLHAVIQSRRLGRAFGRNW